MNTANQNLCQEAETILQDPRKRNRATRRRLAKLSRLIERRGLLGPLTQSAMIYPRLAFAAAVRQRALDAEASKAAAERLDTPRGIIARMADNMSDWARASARARGDQ